MFLWNVNCLFYWQNTRFPGAAVTAQAYWNDCYFHWNVLISIQAHIESCMCVVYIKRVKKRNIGSNNEKYKEIDKQEKGIPKNIRCEASAFSRPIQIVSIVFTWNKSKRSKLCASADLTVFEIWPSLTGFIKINCNFFFQINNLCNRKRVSVQSEEKRIWELVVHRVPMGCPHFVLFVFCFVLFFV